MWIGIAIGLGGLLLAGWLVGWWRHRARTHALWRAVGRDALEPPAAGGAAADSGSGRFDPAMLDGLCAPARRYLEHAIAAGTPLAGAVELAGTGEIRLGERFRPLRYRERLAAGRGFVWQAALRSPVRVVDHYLDDQGGVHGLVLGLPLIKAAGADVTRSSRHRFAIELIWLPAALLPQAGVEWEGIDQQRARAKLLIDAEPIDLELQVAADGRLERVEMQRWSDQRPPGAEPAAGAGRWRLQPYAGRVLAEAAHGGYRIPTAVEVGPLPTAGAADFSPSIRLQVDRARFG